MNGKDIKCVLLADRHHSLSEGVRGLLQSQFHAVTTVTDEDSLLESASRMLPNVVVADLTLTKGESFGWLRRLLLRWPEARVVVLSAYDESTVKLAAFEAGAMAFVRKSEISSELINAVNEVLAGRQYGPPESLKRPVATSKTIEHPE